MKKILSVLLAASLMLTLTGCGDEDKKPNSTAENKKVEKTEKAAEKTDGFDKAIKDFIPANYASEQEARMNWKENIEGVYYCNGKDFLKKTKGWLGKRDIKITYDGDEYSITGYETNIPPETETLYFNTQPAFSFKIKNGTNDDIENNAKKIEKFFPGICIDYETPGNYNTLFFEGFEDEGIILGTIGTINGKKAIVDRKNKLIFYEYDN